MIRKSDALVLRSLRYSNSSLIVTFLTRDHGQVAVVAKGARKPPKKGVYQRPPEPFCHGELVWYASRTGDLGTQSSWSEYQDFPALRCSLASLRAATRLVEVATALTRGTGPAPELYDQLLLTLAAVNATAAIEPLSVEMLGLLVLHCDLHVLEAGGYGLSFDTCADCGGSLHGRWLGFAADDGGALCGTCYDQRRLERDRNTPRDAVVPLSPDAAAVAAALQRCGVGGVSRIRLARSPQLALRAALDAALARVIGRELRCFRASRRRWRRRRA